MQRFLSPLAMVVIAVFSALCWTPSAAAAPAPKREPIYDEKADARKDIAAAVERAGKENKRVLLVIGGNWCGWCYKLHDLFKDNKEVRDVLRAEYEVVNVDDKKRDVIGEYKVTPQGFPYLAVLDAKNQLVTQQETGSLEEGPKHDLKKVIGFLEKWKAEPLNAKQVFDDALAKAAKEDKRVFIRFGAPWCGWCVKLDKLLAAPDVDAALQSDLVVVKIDTQRMADGASIQQKYQTGGGIPWFAVLDSKGQTLFTSELPGSGNVGFPAEPAEVEHVVKILTDGRKRMTDGQVTAVRDAFAKAAAAAKESLRK